MMIHKRRILSFPTVSPCVGISPTTLLASLITLSHQICDFRSKIFTTQRRYAKQTIRHVGILLEFFEDVWAIQPPLSASVLLCFSELHFAFQKINFLLEDCSREGARTWMLMKSELVSYEFWLVIRSISTILDILPLYSINVCDEVKELVGLVSRQVSRVHFELDCGDEYAMTETYRILECFEKGIEPHLGVMKRVLDYIKIRTWSDCMKEIKFLEEEIQLDCSDRDGKELTLVSSLLGFMSYCRGVIFEESDSYQTDTKQNSEIFTGLNPEDFRCPISLELMTDPVTISTGQTYDRSSIEKWFKSGNLICPKTGEKLTTSFLVPNLNLRKLIHQFCADYGISLVGSARKNRDTTILPGSSSACRAVKFLSRFLVQRLVFGTVEQKKKVASEIRLLSESNVFNTSCLVDAGTIPPLLNILCSVDAEAQETAIAALLKLSKHKKGRKVMMECGGLRSIVSVLDKGHTMESKQTAAAAICYLSRVKGCQKLIGEMPDAVPALVALIRDGKSRGQKNAVLTILGLLLNRENHQRVLEAGTVLLLVNILATSEKADLITDSLAVLALLSETANGAMVILETPVLPLIVGFVKCSISREGKEYSVSILLSMCVHGGEDVVATLARDLSLTASLYSLMSNGVGGGTTSSGTKKARSLIKILLDFNDRNYSPGMNYPLPGERFRNHGYNVL